MPEAGGGIDVVVGETEAEFFQNAARGYVIRMMPGEEGLHSQRIESVTDHAAGRLPGQALSPERGAKMEAQLVDRACLLVGSQARASHVLIRSQQKDGPILDVLGGLPGDFLAQLFRDLFGGKGTTNPSGDLLISPKGQGERQILRSPSAEPESRAGQKVVLSAAHESAITLHLAARRRKPLIRTQRWWRQGAQEPGHPAASLLPVGAQRKALRKLFADPPRKSEPSHIEG